MAELDRGLRGVPRSVSRLSPTVSGVSQVYVGPPNIESGTYRGRDEYADLLVRWGAHWEEMRIEPREMSGHGDWVLALVDYHGRSKESHVAIQQPSWEVSRWSGGRCVEYEVYWDEEDGREAFARRGG